MKTLDRCSGTFLLLVGIFICIESYRVSLGDLHNPGPGFFPFLTGLIISGLSLVQLIQSIQPGKLEAIAFWEEQNKVPKLIFCILSLPAYGFFLEKVGFIPCTLLFIGFVAKAVAGLGWRNTGVLSVLSSLAAYVLFQVLLKTEFPRGFLGI